MAGQPLTAKNLRPVKSGVGYAVNDTLGPAEVAQLDEQLSEFGLSAVGPDTVEGVLSLQQDPNNPGDQPLVTAQAGITVSVPGATVGTTPGGGTLVVVGPPVFVGYRSRRVRYSFLEVCRSYPNAESGGTDLTEGCAPTLFRVPGSTLPGIGVKQTAAFTQGHGLFTLPVPKIHDGATLSSASAWFFVPGVPEALPVMPTIQVIRFDFATGVTNGLDSGAASFPTPSSPAAWYAGGDPQQLTVACTINNVISVGNYAYNVVVQDAGPANATELPRPVWTAIELLYTNIADERFTQ